jgi:hypothetical protein
MTVLFSVQKTETHPLSASARTRLANCRHLSEAERLWYLRGLRDGGLTEIAPLIEALEKEAVVFVWSDDEEFPISWQTVQQGQLDQTVSALVTTFLHLSPHKIHVEDPACPAQRHLLPFLYGIRLGGWHDKGQKELECLLREGQVVKLWLVPDAQI